MDLLNFRKTIENENLETAINIWEKELNYREKG